MSSDTTLDGGLVSSVPGPEELLRRIDSALLGGTGQGSQHGTSSGQTSVRVATAGMTQGSAAATATTAAVASSTRGHASSAKADVMWQQCLHGAQSIVLVIQRHQARLLRAAVRSLFRTQMARFNEDLRMQTQSLVGPLLIRKAQAFALRMASFCHRVQSSLKLVGIHAWRHYCLKETTVQCQVRMLQLISEVRQKAIVARSDAVIAGDMEAMSSSLSSSNIQLRKELKRQYGLHRCIAVIVSSSSRRVNFAFSQLRLFTRLPKVPGDLKGLGLAMHSSIRRPCRRQLHWALRQWAQWHELRRAKHTLMDALMVREAMRRTEGSGPFPVS